MSSVLVGCTGFVGQTLLRSSPYDRLIHRTNLQDLIGRQCESIICAGLPATKWIANRQPEEDLRNMQDLCSALDTVTAERFVLISTIDVYPILEGADEDFDCSALPNHAYGSHRLLFEQYVRRRFPHAVIARLPALFGTGLRKNALFDLLNDNGVDAINPESRFQWYPVARLHDDIKRAETSNVRLVNLVTEPVAIDEVVRRFFPEKSAGEHAAPAVRYNLTTRHAAAFGGNIGHIMSANEVLREIGAFVRAARKPA